MHDQGPTNPDPTSLFPFTSGKSPISKDSLPASVDLLMLGQDTPCLRFPGLSGQGVLKHWIFTRHGGASEPPFHSLNMSLSVGDRPEHVDANVRRTREITGAETLMFMNQVHGDVILVIRGSDNPPREAPSVDAMITDVPGRALMVKQADCQGVIILDPNRKVLAVAHCGWRGSVRNILGGVVNRMKDIFNCRGEDLLAAVGPSLGPCCSEFVDHRDMFPKGFQEFMVGHDHFDLWGISRRQLMDAGLEEANIEFAGLCTRCRTDLFFSYRAEGRTGRFGTAAMLV